MARGFLLFVILVCACHLQAAIAGQPQYLEIHMQSPLLSAFWETPVDFDAHVLLPDSYYKEPQRRYPIFYWIEAFDARGTVSLPQELDWQRPMREQHEEYIVVFLNGMFHDGHDEFADSANNGPWGTALTTEFIPQTEAHFRAIGTAATRFVGGHSSGGWSALWLQIIYPELFGAEWSISPDPVDFRDFTGPDLTRSPPQNFFGDDAGHMYMLEDMPLSVFVVERGWRIRQFESFDAVFSPTGADGRPRQLFDRRTGVIDAEVAKYWEEHYDIARILRDNWARFAPQLHGKLHIVVGSSDQFALERPVALLEKELRGLGSDAQFDYVKGANHFTVFDWRGGAIGEIVREASSKLPADAP